MEISWLVRMLIKLEYSYGIDLFVIGINLIFLGRINLSMQMFH